MISPTLSIDKEDVEVGVVIEVKEGTTRSHCFGHVPLSEGAREVREIEICFLGVVDESHMGRICETEVYTEKKRGK